MGKPDKSKYAIHDLSAEKFTRLSFHTSLDVGRSKSFVTLSIKSILRVSVLLTNYASYRHGDELYVLLGNI